MCTSGPNHDGEAGARKAPAGRATDAYSAEKHPDEVIAALHDVSEREIRRLAAEERHLAKVMRSSRRYKATREDLGAIPF